MPYIAVLGLDFLLAIGSYWFATLLTDGDAESLNLPMAWLFCPISAITMLVFLQANGIYKTIYRYVGVKFFIATFRSVLWYFLLILAMNWIVDLHQEFSVLLIQALIFLVLIFLSRVVVSSVLINIRDVELINGIEKNTLIYGAGEAGIQLATTFVKGAGYKLKGFVDDDEQLRGKNINTYPIYHSSELATTIEKNDIVEIFLALPSISSARYHEILNALSEFKVQVKTLPKLRELAQGRVRLRDIRGVNIEDLLLRSTVEPNEVLLKKNITEKVVLVTGAAGSVGGELCRQIIKLQPSKLVLIDNSEFQLYKVAGELQQECKKWNVELIPLLASVTDRETIFKIIEKWTPDTLYHAAAYKHVPIVEANLSSGIKNNVFGTLYTAQAALAHDVKNFILISTDKAVRPTSVMGASKRIAEIILQALSEDSSLQSKKTCFSMVRFGNVLGSSGSVVPLFKRQIDLGGPITLSDPLVTRYFMTITEAAQLVIQASAMAKGGDVFLLDMGTPIKIIDLAEKMVNLAGLQIKSAANPDGDIEIVVTGLKTGEKLYEELLIKDARLETEHPKIMKAKEEFISWEVLAEFLIQLQASISNFNAIETIKILKSIVPEYSPADRVVDQIYH